MLEAYVQFTTFQKKAFFEEVTCIAFLKMVSITITLSKIPFRK